MSTVKELADAEAARAEAENPEEEEGAEEEEALPETQSEPEPGPVGPTEDQMRALDREDKRHEKALAQLMGADFSYFARCGSCDGLGYFMPPPPAELKFKPHPDTWKCETCDGMGDVLSGAVGRNQTLQCPDCGGQGYKSRRATEPLPVPSPVPASPPVANGADDPRVAQLRAEGFTVVPPYTPPTPLPS
jgi:hypothetical protein